jgi:hypothetical protein
MKPKKKSILQTLRDIRDKQSKKYYSNPELMEQDLKKIREKYNTKPLKSDVAVI